MIVTVNNNNNNNDDDDNDDDDDDDDDDDNNNNNSNITILFLFKSGTRDSMRSGPQSYQNQNRLMLNSSTTWNDGAHTDLPCCGSQVDTKNVSTLEAPFSFADGNPHESQKFHLENRLEAGKSVTPSKPIIKQSAENNGMISAMDSVDEPYDEPWSPIIFPLLECEADEDGRKMSLESIDSKTSFPSLDDTPSLDEVFEVLNEMELFGAGLPVNASLTTPSTHPIHDLPHSYSFDDPYQLPVDHISSSNPCKSFQSFNFGIVNGLQTPTRGLVTVVRKLCELLSEPRSDHLNFVFVRLLNNALTEMEDAVQRQSTRPRRNRQNKSASDAERSLKPANSELSRSLTSLPSLAFSTRKGSCIKTVDLTSSEDWEKENFRLQQDSHEIDEKEPFIALEDTLSEFMVEPFPFSDYIMLPESRKQE